MANQDQDINRFYDLMNELTNRLGGPRRLRECTGSSGWPRQGVYFFFEETEARINASPRVVRIGTHALIEKSTTTLWNRLSTHRGNLRGSRPGGGNHRASIFRLHVGTALLSRGDWPTDVQNSWRNDNVDNWTKQNEYPLEQAVSQHIGAMPFLWLEVADRQSRGLIERNTIGLLSIRSGGLDQASPEWLGLTADNEKVRASALWNVNHVDDTYDPVYLDTFSQLIRNVKLRA